MALHTDTAIYKTTYDLAQLATRLVSQMSRNYKPTLGADFQRLCHDLVMRVYEANTSEDRVRVLAAMRKEVERANLMARLAKDLKLISHGQYAQVIALLSSTGKQATGWLKHSEKRLSPGRQGGRANAHR